MNDSKSPMGQEESLDQVFSTVKLGFRAIEDSKEQYYYVASLSTKTETLKEVR